MPAQVRERAPQVGERGIIAALGALGEASQMRTVDAEPFVGGFERQREEGRARMARNLEAMAKVPGLADTAKGMQQLDADYYAILEHNKDAPPDVRKAAENKYLQERGLLWEKCARSRW